MTAKDYLRQLWLLDKEINEKQKELRELEEMATSLSSPKYSDMPKAHNGSDTVSDAVIRIIDMQNYINDKIDKYIDLKFKIIKQIDGLEDIQQRVVLFGRYINHKGWYDIADDMNYSVQHIYRIHGYALAEFEKQYLKHERK